MAYDAKDRRRRLAAANNAGCGENWRRDGAFYRRRPPAAVLVKRAATVVDGLLMADPGRRTLEGRLRSASGEGWAVGRLLSGVTVASNMVVTLRVASRGRG